MADKPPAEVEIDARLVRTLLDAQRPDLSALPLRLVAHGWDNATWRLGDSLAVRLPRRAASCELVRHEQRALPVLQPGIDLPLPVPVHRGVPSQHYPWRWSIVPYFDGVPAGSIEREARDGIAAGLARFVDQMHRPAPPDAPHNPFRGIDLAERTTAVHQRLATESFPRAAQARALWDALVETTPWRGAPTWVHGDLHPYNILLALPTGDAPPQAPTIRAIIDFGDVTAGDPATDLATAWLTFGPAGRRLFIDEVTRLRAIDSATWRRARAWALSMASAMIAHSDDDPPFARLGRAALDEVLDDAGPEGGDDGPVD